MKYGQTQQAFPHFLSFILCLVMETKTVTVSDVVINVKDNYKLERIKCPKKGKFPALYSKW